MSISPKIINNTIANTYSIFNKALQALIILNNKSDSDYLTILESGDTPTLDDSEAPSIKALNEAQAADAMPRSTW
jgi:hypothetical protein